MKESSPSGIQSERTGTVAKVVFSIVIIALAIYLIYVFNMVGKTGVIVGVGGVLRENMEKFLDHYSININRMNYGTSYKLCKFF